MLSAELTKQRGWMDGSIEEDLVFIIPQTLGKMFVFFCSLQQIGLRYREMRIISYLYKI